MTSLTARFARLEAFLAARRFAPASRAEVERVQSKRLRRLVRHAYEQVPYYRELFERHGLSPASLASPRDLARLPPTTRETMQRRGSDLYARDAGAERVASLASSGSAGRLLRMPRDWLENRTLAAIRARETAALGAVPGDRIAIAKTLAQSRPPAAGFAQRMLGLVAGDRWPVIDCMLEPEDFAGRLERVRPDVLAGYPAQLCRVARTVAGDRLRAVGIRLLCTGGEILTEDQRALLATAFGAVVRDTYACFEVDLMARECPHAGGYHVCEDGVILEVVADGRPVAVGERGEVVVTGLHGHVMPFLRYALGDFVERGPTPCPCGAPVSTIRAIHGRIVDFFVLPDGRVLHPYGIFIPIRESAPWMRRFQVRQLARDHVLMRVEAEPLPDGRAIASVRERALAAFGPQVRFELELVDEIPPDPSGKFQTYRSQVSPP